MQNWPRTAKSPKKISKKKENTKKKQQDLGIFRTTLPESPFTNTRISILNPNTIAFNSNTEKTNEAVIANARTDHFNYSGQ